MSLLLTFVFILGGPLGSALQSDEVVTFFPTFAAQSADGKFWNVRLHAWVYEPEEGSFSRRALLRILSKRLELSEKESESATFQDRARLFLVDNERGKTVAVHIAGQRFEIGPSGSNGHIRATVQVPVESVRPADVTEQTSWGRLVRVAVDTPGVPSEGAAFAIPFIDPDGVSVVSDLDDTIKISEVASRRALLLNTFCRPFQPVPGMAALYRGWAAEGAVFHYVSASPWQLQLLIREFLTANGFPDGSLSLKTFRWKDSSFFDLFAKSDAIKGPFIENLLEAFPRRKFILVGDSGERDPELYASLARKYPDQVRVILIRNSTGGSSSAGRWDAVFGAIARDRWRLFTEAGEVEEKRLADFVR